MTVASHLVMLGPARCVGCHAPTGWLCARCAADAVAPREDVVIKGVTRTVAPFAYEGGPRALVLALKLRQMRAASEPLVRHMVRAWRTCRTDADVVAWVPARTRDKARRGFDHAELLARRVAGSLGLPTATLLRRRGFQQDQAGLGRGARLHNSTGAFVASTVDELNVLLVDDLVTTGATAAACGEALRAAGARSVQLLVACRA